MYAGGIQARFICVIMMVYKPFVCVIIFFSRLNKQAYTATNLILYWVNKTVFSDAWVLLFLVTSWIYSSDSPMWFWDILTLKTRSVRRSNKSYGTPVKSQRSNSCESSAFMWSHHCETLRQVDECYRCNVPCPTSLKLLHAALSDNAQF
jgi:hypothetical protein